MHVLILSPHRDDAAFSCGLLAAGLLRQDASLTVVNICTASDYAPYLEADASTRSMQVTKARVVEDERFFAALCAHAGVAPAMVSEVNLGWSDAPLRLSIPAESVLAEDAPKCETEALASAFQHLPLAEIVLAPLALGGHLDHRLVRQAAVSAFRQELCFYEDLPYAARMTAEQRETEIAATGLDLQAWTYARSEAGGTKRAFANCYPSQIAPDVADEMEQYARERGGSETVYFRKDNLHLLAQLEGTAE